MVVAVGAILISMALKGFGSTTSRLAVMNARESFAAIHARARSYAVERGTLARLHTDPAGDSVWVESGGARIEGIDYGESRNVDLQSATTGVITLCMNPRGFAETACNSFSSSVSLTFVQGGEEASVTILPLGQLRW